MSRFQAHFRRRRFGLNSFSATAVLCLLLMGLLAFAQVAHVHSNPSDADHCMLCVAMHSAVPAATVAAIVVFVQLGFSAPVAKARAMVRYWQPQLFTRPPPAGF